MEKVRQREIKFRGLYNGGWVYGDLIQTEKDFKKVYQILDWIGEKGIKEVPLDTIGQYTGLKDRTGKEIYEGDILRDDEATYKIYWASDACAFDAERLEDGSAMIGFGCYGRDLIADIIQSSKVIGNIFEHPHLLSQGEIKTELI